MSGECRDQQHTLRISEPLFRLATQSVHLYSNDTGRLHTLESLVSDRALFVESLDHNLETIRMHLEAVASEGDIRIDLALSPHTAARLEDARQALKTLIGSDVTLADTISIMLFDYMVEQKANKVRAKLGIGNRSRQDDSSSFGSGEDDKVIRLK